MALAVGNLQYSLGRAPVTGEGRLLSAADLDAALDGPVRDAVLDSAGEQGFTNFLEGFSETEFDQTGLERVFSAQGEPESWRVGEGVAEVYLSDHYSCHFPWPDSRDERRSGSSLPGADLVGVCSHAASDRFAFGEVKTSQDRNYPPGVVYGRGGLKQQIEDLKQDVSVRDDLVRYLAHRAPRTPWAARFVAAFVRYCADSTDVSVFGVLVRDVVPDQDDLRARVTGLASNCPGRMTLSLLALYIPAGSIQGLGQRVADNRHGGTT